MEEEPGGGNETAGMCGLRKQVTGAKEGPLELRREKAKRHTYRKKVWMTYERERER